MANESTEMAPPRPGSTRARSLEARGGMATWLRVGGWLLAVALLGLNAWWAWREIRPVADLQTIGGWINQGRLDEAERELRERIRRSPHDGGALELLGRSLAARGDSLGCARTLNRVPIWWPTKPSMLFLEGQAFKSVDRMADADAAWKGLSEFDALHPMPESLLSKAVMERLELYALEERWEDARRLIWKAYDQAEPVDRPALLGMLMRTELERIAPATSVVKLRRFVEADPEDWEARRALAMAEHATGDNPAANRLILECLKARPDDPRAWRGHLKLLHEQGDADGLAQAVAKVPPAAAEDPEVLRYRAIAQETRGDWEAAAAIYRLLDEKRPSNGEYLFRLAAAEERTGKRESAQKHRDASKRIRAARADLNAAFQAYLEASKGDSPDPRALTNAVNHLSRICEALGWKREAEAWARLAPTG